MRRLRAIGRWLSDWRNGATVIVSVLVALVAYVVIDGRVTEHQALDAAKQSLDVQERTSTNARRRIDLLNQRIVDLSEKVEDSTAESRANGVRIEALQEQVRQLGGEPVIVTPRRPETTTTTSRPTAGATTTTTTTTRPAPPPEDDCALRLLGRCIGGSG